MSVAEINETTARMKISETNSDYEQLKTLDFTPHKAIKPHKKYEKVVLATRKGQGKCQAAEAIIYFIYLLYGLYTR